jgi:hypothetical protein
MLLCLTKNLYISIVFQFYSTTLYPLKNKMRFPDYLNFTFIPSMYLDIRMQFYNDRRKSINMKLFGDI